MKKTTKQIGRVLALILAGAYLLPTPSEAAAKGDDFIKKIRALACSQQVENIEERINAIQGRKGLSSVEKQKELEKLHESLKPEDLSRMETRILEMEQLGVEVVQMPNGNWLYKAPKNPEKYSSWMKSEGFSEPTKGSPIQGGGGLRERWFDQKGVMWEWDSKKGELEKWIGSRHEGGWNLNGQQISPAIPSRRLGNY